MRLMSTDNNLGIIFITFNKSEMIAVIGKIKSYPNVLYNNVYKQTKLGVPVSVNLVDLFQTAIDINSPFKCIYYITKGNIKRSCYYKGKVGEVYQISLDVFLTLPTLDNWQQTCACSVFIFADGIKWAHIRSKTDLKKNGLVFHKAAEISVVRGLNLDLMRLNILLKDHYYNSSNIDGDFHKKKRRLYSL